jgi:hypothetical protein
MSIVLAGAVQIARAAASTLTRLDEMNRSRLTYLMAAIVVVVLGLSSRKYSRVLPEFVVSYAGDTLWALTAYLGVGMLFPRWSTLRVAVTALLFAFAIELSQLYHSPGTDQIRRTMVGGLILGYGFLWSDLLCYVVGVSVGCALEMLLKGLNARQREAGLGA